MKHFLCFINHLLPLRLKFAKESFVALVDNKEKGIITLEKDSKSTTRFKITKLILEEGHSSLAHQLTNYVITRYRAMGAHTFYAVVDENQNDLINIFKDETGFRDCGSEYLYKINSINNDSTILLKSLKEENIKDCAKFYNENITSFNRHLFARDEYQFRNNCLKYIFSDEDKILGYFEVATKNNTDFYINFSIDCAYGVYLLDALKFIYSKIQRKTKNFNLYIKIKDYFINSKELITILNENNFHFVSKSRILAKDFYREIKELDILKHAKIIFNDPTTA